MASNHCLSIKKLHLKKKETTNKNSKLYFNVFSHVIGTFKMHVSNTRAASESRRLQPGLYFSSDHVVLVVLGDRVNKTFFSVLFSQVLVKSRICMLKK